MVGAWVRGDATGVAYEVSDVLIHLAGLSGWLGDTGHVTAWLGGLSARYCLHLSMSGSPSGSMGMSVGDAALVRAMGVDPLDRGSGVIRSMSSLNGRLDLVSIGDGGSAVNSGMTSSNWVGGSTGGMTGSAAGSMMGGATGGMMGGITGGAGGTTVVGAGGAEVVGGGSNGWG